MSPGGSHGSRTETFIQNLVFSYEHKKVCNHKELVSWCYNKGEVKSPNSESRPSQARRSQHIQAAQPVMVYPSIPREPLAPGYASYWASENETEISLLYKADLKRYDFSTTFRQAKYQPSSDLFENGHHNWRQPSAKLLANFSVHAHLLLPIVL